jgi:5-methylcytosine-specific restriction protein A
VREPVQPTPRRAMTPKRRLEALLRSNGRCALCKVKLGEAYEVDHTITLFLAGADDESNTLALCVPCHRGVKTPADAKVHAKVRRLLARQDGTRRPRPPIPSRGFDKSKTKKFNGEVVAREV